MGSELLVLIGSSAIWTTLVLLVKNSSYRMGLCDGYEAFRSNDPLWKKQRETVRMYLGHKYHELLVDGEFHAD